MKYVTRFNPTTNGQLHIGHAYMALVNECEARRSGGKFVLRFDDDQVYWNHIANVDVTYIKQAILDDLAWLGIVPDEIVSEQGDRTKMEQASMHICNPEPAVVELFYSAHLPELPTHEYAAYPYHAWLTAHKVIYDFMNGVNLLIRGEDLLDEYSLYSYFCDAWGLPLLRHVYIPRLMMMKRGQEAEIAGISKTAGNMSIDSLRASGLTKTQVLEKLRHACLKDESGMWTIQNIKAMPLWE
jgi:glutamyl/glutaminyl-tRNA synthetase